MDGAALPCVSSAPWIRSGVHAPVAINNKNNTDIGLQAHFNPIAVWMRGLLKHEYGVSPDEMRWVTNSDEQVSPWEPPAWLRIEKAPSGRRVPEMLEAGDIDAYMLPTLGSSFRAGKSVGRRLWPNYREAEADYYRRTGIYPMRHTVVIKDEVLERHPWVASSLLQAFEEAKTLGLEHMRDPRRSYLAWYGEAVEEEDEKVPGRDPLPYSVEAQRHTIDTMLLYAAEQAVTTRRLSVEELFVPSTLG